MPSHSPRSVSPQFPLPLPHMITSSRNASKPILDLLSQSFHGMEPRELCFKMVLTLKFEKHWFRLVRTHAWSWVGGGVDPIQPGRHGGKVYSSLGSTSQQWQIFLI